MKLNRDIRRQNIRRKEKSSSRNFKKLASRANFLLEIGVEEIPASYIPPVLRQLREAGKRWAPDADVVAWGSPRRLLLFLRDLPRFRMVALWGPPLERSRDERGAWNQNAVGFARSQGKKPDDLEVGDKNGKRYLKLKLRRESGEEIAEAIPALLQSLAFPKSMRWLPGIKFRFARPIRWLVCLWGTRLLPVQAAGVKAGRSTFGHRFFGPGPWRLSRADLGEYERCLRRHAVLVDPGKRKAAITAALLARQKKIVPGAAASVLDRELIEEVCYLVEYPRVMLGRFEERYLSLPSEILMTAMKTHQRYFPVRDEAGRLRPAFLFVAGGPYRDHRVITRNNEKVLKARLSDAEFFWKEDGSRKLAERVPALGGLVFHERLGSYLDKTRRLERLAPFIAGSLGYPPALKDKAARAALLCKADLTTAMVTEFTELQGTMGREYSLRSGEDAEVAEAIGEHYLPRSSEDGLPGTPVGTVLALADRLDTVAAFVSAGIVPTGSQDPYGLRRQSLGAIRILVEKRLSLAFSALAEGAAAGLNLPPERREKALRDIHAFFQARLEGYLEGCGVPVDVARAVLASGWDDFQDVKRRIEMLTSRLGSDLLQAATTIVERTYNIFRNERFDRGGEVRPELLQAEEERKLREVYRERSPAVENAVGERDYRKATELYARAFSRPLHDFFERVMVNVESAELKENRLRLLYRINRLYTDKVADLALLQFERGEYIL